MTSLALQLKRLALPQSDPNLLTRKEVASLLFDPKDAATMDRSSFYALGESGPDPEQNRVPVLPLTASPPHLQAARGWRSCWELSRLSWSSRTLCLAPPP